MSDRLLISYGNKIVHKIAYKMGAHPRPTWDVVGAKRLWNGLLLGKL